MNQQKFQNKNIQTKYLKYTLIFIVILLIAIYVINEANSPQNKMKTFLETQDYESITFYKAIDSGPSNTPDDINISFTVDSTDDLIKNVFSVKAELERETGAFNKMEAPVFYIFIFSQR